MSNDDLAEIGRKRTTQIFRYLQALDQIRNPARRTVHDYTWTFWLKSMPDHPSACIGQIDTIEEGVEGDTSFSADDYILKVTRPKVQPAPAPPQELSDWLLRGWEDIHQEIGWHAHRQMLNQEGLSETILFEADPERASRLEEWRVLRDCWVQEEMPAYRTMELFERLYELYGQMQREAERLELVLGDGILNWKLPDGSIHHPVLLLRLQMEFRPDVPEFMIRQAEYPVELYSSLFQTMNDVPGRIADVRKELEQGQFHPLSGNDTSGFLKSFVARLAANGEFVEGEPSGYKEYPRIGRFPVLFLRNRTIGFGTALDSIVQHLAQRTDLPLSLLRIAGLEAQPTAESGAGTIPAFVGEDSPEILLSKPANPEQVQIAERLDRHGCVLVQGPPGTGKSHTIANLIGHLLAQGKTILVTSHTTKALKVLRGQVVSALQPLCVSVLESGGESRAQLESSVSGIVERLAKEDEASLEAKAQRLIQRRKQFPVRLSQLEANILEVQGSEYRDIVLAGHAYPPADAARIVATGKDQNAWIPDPLYTQTLPLTNAEIVELYASNVAITPEDEHEPASSLPVPDQLLTPSVFVQLLTEQAQIRATETVHRDDLWACETYETEVPLLEQTGTHLASVIEGLNTMEAWELAVIVAARNETRRQLWQDLLALIRRVTEHAIDGERVLVERAPSLSMQIPRSEIEHTLEDIITHVRQSGKLSAFTLLTKPAWRRVQKECAVNGKPPIDLIDFEALQTLVRLHTKRDELVQRWERQVVVIGGPALPLGGTSREVYCSRYTHRLETCIQWHDSVWLPTERMLQEAGFQWKRYAQSLPPVGSEANDLLTYHTAIAEKLTPILAARVQQVRLTTIQIALRDLTAQLKLVGKSGDSRIVTELREAVLRQDPELYREAFERLAYLHSIQSLVTRRRELLHRLDAAAPTWAACIQERTAPHNTNMVPGDVGQAWIWRHLSVELDRRASQSLDQLYKDRETLTRELQQVTAELIECKAWACQIRRTTLAQQQALIGWLNIMRRIGAGTGKRVHILRDEARKKMEESRSAVPVWIMPLSRVVENFDPATARFDVLIIDEASQADAMGLIPCYMAKSVVVVGDNEQVSPDAVGQNLDIAQRLIEEHLQGIPNAVLYDGQQSIYELALQSFGGHIRLTEHFRCAPEIIQYSNWLSYEGEIKPLRDTSAVPRKPHVIAYHVAAATSRNKINPIEAKAVASLLLAAAEQPEYKDSTFGVISLVGEEQARQIDTLLHRYMEPNEYLKRRVMCGTPPQFQGDERDVMFLSVVDGPESGPLRLRNFGPREMYKKRFNVAASRARDQMWVVHSLQPDVDLQPGDIRRGLIEHAQNPADLMTRFEDVEQYVESEFEREVARRLIVKGFRVKPQWKVGQYRIDLVVEDGDKRLAVECDGDRYHPLEKLSDDMARQAILERLGWTFVRIRGSLFFRNPDSAMEPVFTRLERMDIQPTLAQKAAEAEQGVTSELLDRIIRRAEALRQEWDGPILEPETLIGRVGASDSMQPNHVDGPDAAIVEINDNSDLLTQDTLDLGAVGYDEQHLLDALYQSIPGFGRKIERQALLQSIATQLGYDRLSRDLRSKLNKTINSEVNSGHICIDAAWETLWKPIDNLSLFE